MFCYFETQKKTKTKNAPYLKKHFKRIVAIPVFILMLCVSYGFSQSESNDSPNIPFKFPIGFNFAKAPEFYGTYEKPQKNGTIYDYINGGGEVYIKHGFRSVTHMNLKDSAQNTITFNIFDMATPKNAEAALADEAISPKGFTPLNIGTNARTYHYEPDYIINFVKGKYLFTLSLSNDSLSPVLKRYAKVLFKNY